MSFAANGTLSLIVHIDGWLEDSWSAASRYSTDGKHSDARQQPSLLQINPSYGVIPKPIKNAKETETSTINVDVYVNDPQQTTAVAEEYEYMSISPSSTEQPRLPTKQSMIDNDLECSDDYENDYLHS